MLFRACKRCVEIGDAEVEKGKLNSTSLDNRSSYLGGWVLVSFNKKKAEKTKTTKRIPAWENQRMCLCALEEYTSDTNTISTAFLKIWLSSLGTPQILSSQTLVLLLCAFATLCLCSSCSNDAKTLIGDVSGYNCKMNISTKAESSGITKKN